MSRRHIQTVIALALSASLLTMSSWVVAQKTGQEHGVLKAPTAATDGATAPSNAAGKTTPTIGGTKLQLRSSKPLRLNDNPPTDGWGYKLLACLFIVAGAMWLYRKRGALKPTPASHDLTIVSRTSIGVRSELLIVNVDGQRLLIGVTAGSIQRLATLPDPLDAVTLASPQDEKKLDGIVDEHEPNELTAIPVAEQALRKAASASSEGDEVEPGFDHFMDKAQERLAALRSSGKLSRRSAPKRDEQADSLIAMLAGRRQG